jgi:AcrR family transcriptional regulator
MPRDDAAEEAPLRTHRDAVTRELIVRAAARIVFSRGVAGTSIEQVLTASNASRSQFHRYFVNKEAVIGAVVDFQVNPCSPASGRCSPGWTPSVGCASGPMPSLL